MYTTVFYFEDLRLALQFVKEVYLEYCKVIESVNITNVSPNRWELVITSNVDYPELFDILKELGIHAEKS